MSRPRCRFTQGYQRSSWPFTCQYHPGLYRSAKTGMSASPVPKPRQYRPLARFDWGATRIDDSFGRNRKQTLDYSNEQNQKRRLTLVWECLPWLNYQGNQGYFIETNLWKKRWRQKSSSKSLHDESGWTWLKLRVTVIVVYFIYLSIPNQFLSNYFM